MTFTLHQILLRGTIKGCETGGARGTYGGKEIKFILTFGVTTSMKESTCKI